MSRLAKKPIKIPQGVTVKKGDGLIVFMGARGEKKLRIPADLNIKIEDEKIWVEASGSLAEAKRNIGTIWSLIKNSTEGVKSGFSKVLEIEGVGYKAALEGTDLVLFLGYTAPVRFKLPEGISADVEKNVVKISGVDKDLVGRTAAAIRALKKPEPYKGKGIHYRGEVIKRKVGKKAGGAAATGATA